MEHPLSSRSSGSPQNRSQDNIEPLALLRSNSNLYKASQSLSSVINTPEASFISYIYDYIQKSLAFGVETSAILQDIHPSDFNPYLVKVSPYLSKKPQNEHYEPSKSCNLEMCFNSIPAVFFSDSFDLKGFIDEHALTQQEVISSYLDMTDLSIFNKISINWKELMSAAFELESMNGEIDFLLFKSKGLREQSVEFQREIMKKYLEVIRLNRRLMNIQKVLQKLKTISDVQGVEPVVNNMINEGLYTSASQLLARTQETFKAELKEIKSVLSLNTVMDRTKATLSNQLDQEFTLLAQKFIVFNTFNHTERLIKMLKASANLDSTYKIFPKEESYERISELIKNKINTNTLQVSLQELTKILIVKIKENIKDLISSLGVHKTDENSKWANISHPHFIIVFQSLISIFYSIFQKFITLSTLVLRQLTPESGSYSQLQKLLAVSKSKDISTELTQTELLLYKIFYSKLKKIMLDREQMLVNSSPSELKELHELTEKIPNICKNLTIATPQQIIQMSLSIQKKHLAAFHERKVSEVHSILEGEYWVKVEVHEEMNKFVMDRRGEASKIAGIKLETPEITATGALLVFYKTLYEYVSLSEDLQISLDCSGKLIEILRLYNRRTYELIVEAQAVPTKFTKVTAKHLGLSVQGLSLLLQELPYIENRLTVKIKDFSTVILPDFTSTKEDLVKHLKSIYEKLSNIIKVRVEEHCKNAVTEAKWETMISPSQMETVYYIKQISTDLTSMNSILSTVLNPSQIIEVFTSILQSLAENLIELFSRIKIDSYIPAQRIKNDTQQLLIFLREKFSSSLLEPLEELEDRLQKFVSDSCERYLR